MSKVHSGYVVGVEGYIGEIQVRPGAGVARITVNGIQSESARTEARIHVTSALAEIAHPVVKPWEVTVSGENLPRAGSASLDFAMLAAVMIAQGDLTQDDEALYVGEVSLGGHVRECRGILPILLAAKKKGIKRAFVPTVSLRYMKFVPEMELFGVHHIDGLLSGDLVPNPHQKATLPRTTSGLDGIPGLQEEDRAILEDAVKNRLNVLIIGAPGTGRLPLAKLLAEALGDMTPEEEQEVAVVGSAVGLDPVGYPRPFRAPHYTVSAVGLLGGGVPTRPGEVSLATHGVLHLDELPEFHPSTLASFAVVMRAGVTRVRAGDLTVEMPARPAMVIGSMTPCPCGYLLESRCGCPAGRAEKYRARIALIEHLFPVTVQLRLAPPGSGLPTQVKVTRKEGV